MRQLRFCVYLSLVNYTEDFLSLASLIMTEENLRAPKNVQEAKSLFLRLITVMDSLQFQNYDYLKCLVTEVILFNKNDCLIILTCFYISCYLVEYCLRIVQLGERNVLRICLKLEANWWTFRVNRLFDFYIKLIIY